MQHTYVTCIPDNFLQELLATSTKCRDRGAGLTHWWEHSSPTNVALVRLPVPVSYVGWVCCWFSSLLREVFLRKLRFSPLLKNQHIQIPIRFWRCPQLAFCAKYRRHLNKVIYFYFFNAIQVYDRIYKSVNFEHSAPILTGATAWVLISFGRFGSWFQTKVIYIHISTEFWLKRFTHCLCSTEFTSG